MGDFCRAIGQARDGKIAVLVFHGVPDPHPWVQTEPAAFGAYMRRLRAEGCRVVAMRELRGYVDVSQAGISTRRPPETSPAS